MNETQHVKRTGVTLVDVVELLIYAAAMSEYRRNNLNPGSVPEINAILRVVEYSDRPRLATEDAC